jgi:hypothetical protein
MAVEQGLSFTVVEAPHPLEDASGVASYDPRRDFYSIKRVYLGWVPGTDWLHDEIERHFGEDNVWYEVESNRDASHVGAAGEVATVVLVLMGAGAIEYSRKFVGKLGERSAEDIYAWVRELARSRRRDKGLEAADGPPDFLQRWEPADIAGRMKSELAGLMRVPESELELVSVDKRATHILATYRLRATGDEYTAEIGTDNVLFQRVGRSSPEHA